LHIYTKAVSNEIAFVIHENLNEVERHIFKFSNYHHLTSTVKRITSKYMCLRGNFIIILRAFNNLPFQSDSPTPDFQENL